MIGGRSVQPMEKTYFDPERYGDHYAILPKESVEGDPYGTDISYIHAKFGNVRKCYNFTDECMEKFPEFTTEYQKYWTDEPSMFPTPMDVVNYLIAHPDVGAEIRPYFNFIDEWADGWEAIKHYLEEEGKAKDKTK